jgi:poly(3-hydroxybutyrate) depolymerase
MILYHLHDWQRAALLPFRLVAEATHATFHNPLFPASHTRVGRVLVAGAELFERTTRNFTKPHFGLHTTKIGGDTVAVTEEIIMIKPFCKLLHFNRATSRADPKVLVVAPMSGHHSTLLRGTVEAMLPDHDVYITDWIDAKLVPLAQGPFDLEDYITYTMDFIRHLGPDVHLIAVCQPAPPVLCAVALLADMKDPAQPRSMTLMGGPIDTRVSKTVVTELADKRPLEWFKNNVIQSLPFYYPGGHRLVYPGFLQLRGFISMNMERHIGEHTKLFRNLVKGDDDSVTAHRKFYDEYLSVMDTPAEFYLQTIEHVFQTHDLAKGTFMWHGQNVRPQSITKTALLTIEGELDDISAPGQTRPALDLCSSLPEKMKKAHLQIGVGHYGIFNGRKWRESILPVVRDWIRTHAEPADDEISDGPNDRTSSDRTHQSSHVV